MVDRTHGMWIAIRLAVSRLPWHLLRGSEKGPRDRLTREDRNDTATDRIFEAVKRYQGSGRPPNTNDPPSYCPPGPLDRKTD
ncbi:MAG: hypothetical protein JNJ73_04585 [Hyphomonadaceae bacterium]|nr:hypothetical protein [Hyphomonadaceae bacterium]